MTVHAFVDETKHKGFVMVAAIVAPRDLAASRAAMRRLCLRGQPRLHFHKERPTRRAAITAAISTLPVRLEIYDASHMADLRAARTACLRQIAEDLTRRGAHRLVLEQDDSLVAADRVDLFDSLRCVPLERRPTYEHLPARTEPLLWIPDAAAWCWTHGAAWQARLQGSVDQVHRL